MEMEIPLSNVKIVKDSIESRGEEPQVFESLDELRGYSKPGKLSANS
jgi:hypothetical protein